MSSRQALLDRQDAVEQQHTLAGPGLKAAVRKLALIKSQVSLDLLNDVQQRRWHTYTRRHGKTQAMGLTFTVVRVLAQNNHLDTLQGGRIEGIKILATGGVNHLALLFLRLQEFFQGQHIRLLELSTKMGKPAGIKFSLGAVTHRLLLIRRSWCVCIPGAKAFGDGPLYGTRSWRGRQLR